MVALYGGVDGNRAPVPGLSERRVTVVGVPVNDAMVETAKFAWASKAIDHRPREVGRAREVVARQVARRGPHQIDERGTLLQHVGEVRDGRREVAVIAGAAAPIPRAR